MADHVPPTLGMLRFILLLTAVSRFTGNSLSLNSNIFRRSQVLFNSSAFVLTTVISLRGAPKHTESSHTRDPPDGHWTRRAAIRAKLESASEVEVSSLVNPPSQFPAANGFIRFGLSRSGILTVVCAPCRTYKTHINIHSNSFCSE